MFLSNNRDVHEACFRGKLNVAQWLIEPQSMQPVAAARGWNLPVIESIGDLADWLDLTVGELQWFADLKGFEHRRELPRLRHYHYRIQALRQGEAD